MPRPDPNDGLDKFQQYRASRQMAGMRLLRVWVPDPRAPGFQDEARRQAALLRDGAEEAEALAFIEITAAWDDPGA